jgi:RimJ/RimL family protein N-acetyltransferase
MLRLRPYKPDDAETILKWIKDEDAFRKWSTDRYPHYPITADDMNHKYMDCNGNCIEPDNFYPMTAFDETGIVGHLILRFTDEEKKVLRFGFVIVDDSKRGMGYGKGMLRLALQFAFDIFKADKVTLGVLENNPGAYYCYKAAGFRDVTGEEPEYYILMGKKIKCLELEITK